MFRCWPVYDQHRFFASSLFIFLQLLLEQTAHTVYCGIALGIDDGSIDSGGIDVAMAKQL